MSRGFGTALEPVEEGRDREITLGPALIVLLVLGLCGICAVCFIAGFAAGRRGSSDTPAAQAAAGSPTAAQLLSGQSKPVAGENGQQAHADVQPAAADTSAAGATYPASPASPPAAVVQTVLPAQPTAGQPVAGGRTVQPALEQTGAQAGSWMVQIAAVSNPEDADVLVGALRKRGYGVSVRRDPVDNLMHVQVGPFATHTDATAMRQRLLNDGYNAIIQP